MSSDVRLCVCPFLEQEVRLQLYVHRCVPGVVHHILKQDLGESPSLWAASSFPPWV